MFCCISFCYVDREQGERRETNEGVVSIIIEWKEWCDQETNGAQLNVSSSYMAIVANEQLIAMYIRM